MKKIQNKLFEGLLQNFPHNSSRRQRSSTYKIAPDPNTKAVSRKTQKYIKSQCSSHLLRERERERGKEREREIKRGREREREIR